MKLVALMFLLFFTLSLVVFSSLASSQTTAACQPATFQQTGSETYRDYEPYCAGEGARSEEVHRNVACGGAKLTATDACAQTCQRQYNCAGSVFSSWRPVANACIDDPKEFPDDAATHSHLCQVSGTCECFATPPASPQPTPQPAPPESSGPIISISVVDLIERARQAIGQLIDFVLFNLSPNQQPQQVRVAINNGAEEVQEGEGASVSCASLGFFDSTLECSEAKLPNQMCTQDYFPEVNNKLPYTDCYFAEDVCPEASFFGNDNCDYTCPEGFSCSVVQPIADGLAEGSCRACLVPSNLSIDYGDLPRFVVTNRTISGYKLYISGITDGNASLIASAEISDYFNGTTTRYADVFTANNTRFAFNQTLAGGLHLLKVEAALTSGFNVSQKVFNDSVGPLFCCTDDSRLAWSDSPVDSLDMCPALSYEIPNRKGFTAKVDAEHGCIFGWICKDNTWTKVRGEAYREAVNQRYLIYPTPEGRICGAPLTVNETVNASTVNESALVAVNGSNASFEFLDINRSYARVYSLPYGNKVHFVVASNSIDMRAQLPITISMAVSGEIVFSVVIPNDPVVNCRGADGCSIDGPIVSELWRGRAVVITATNSTGATFASYSE